MSAHIFWVLCALILIAPHLDEPFAKKAAIFFMIASTIAFVVEAA